MHRIAATLRTARRGHAARALASLASLALAGLLLAPQLGHALPRASASTFRPVVLLNDSGTALTPSTLLSAPFHAMGPVTVAWKVAATGAAGIRSSFTVALMDASGHTRARLVATTRAGRASATTDVDWRGTCYLKMSVANMDYAIVGYTLAPAR
jgi:hypothetical protein